MNYRRSRSLLLIYRGIQLLQRLYYFRRPLSSFCRICHFLGRRFLNSVPTAGLDRQVRRRLIWAVMLYSGGVTAAEYGEISLGTAAGILTLSAGFWALGLWRRRTLWLLRALLIFSLGLTVCTLRTPLTGPENALESLLGRYCNIQGTVSSVYSIQSHRIRLVVRLDRVTCHDKQGRAVQWLSKSRVPTWLKPPVLVLVSVYSSSNGDSRQWDWRAFEPGRRLGFEGRLSLPPTSGNPGLFDYWAYLRRRGISYLTSTDAASVHLGDLQGFNLARMTYLAHRFLKETISSWLPSPSDAVLVGMLLGDASELPESVRKTMQHVGIGHILAVSGLHIGLVCLLILRLSRWMGLGSVCSKILVACGMAAFSALAGWSVSAVRACLAGISGLLLSREDKALDGVSLAAATALVILVWSPLSLFDVGFQLSYSAVLGILLLAPRWQQILRVPLAGPAVGISLAAGVGTFPVVTWYFFAVPVLAPAANLLAVPLVSLILPVGLLGLCLTLIWPAVSHPTAWVTSVAVQVLLKSAEMVHRFPLSYIVVGKPRPLSVCVYVAAVGLLTRWFDRRHFQSPEYCRKSFLITVLTAAALCLWLPLVNIEQPRLRLTAVDVGQGDCILIQDYRGLVGLVDGGGNDTRYSDFDVGAAITLPYLYSLGVDRLDVVINTHPHLDHIGGLVTVAREAKCRVVIDNGTTGFGGSVQLLRELVQQSGGRLFQVEGDCKLVVDSGATRMEIWRPVDSAKACQNDKSLVTKITHGRWSILLTGDLEQNGLRALLARDPDLKADILQIPHHGAWNRMIPPLLQAVRPKVAFISVGRNQFGHPSALTLAVLKQMGIPVLRTDVDGALSMELQGPSGRSSAGDLTLVITTGRGKVMALAK